jgi:hypothetical protein
MQLKLLLCQQENFQLKQSLQQKNEEMERKLQECIDKHVVEMKKLCDQMMDQHVGEMKRSFAMRR